MGPYQHMLVGTPRDALGGQVTKPEIRLAHCTHLGRYPLLDRRDDFVLVTSAALEPKTSLSRILRNRKRYRVSQLCGTYLIQINSTIQRWIRNLADRIIPRHHPLWMIKFGTTIIPNNQIGVMSESQLGNSLLSSRISGCTSAQTAAPALPLQVRFAPIRGLTLSGLA